MTSAAFDDVIGGRKTRPPREATGASAQESRALRKRGVLECDDTGARGRGAKARRGIGLHRTHVDLLGGDHRARFVEELELEHVTLRRRGLVQDGTESGYVPIFVLTEKQHQ